MLNTIAIQDTAILALEWGTNFSYYINIFYKGIVPYPPRSSMPVGYPLAIPLLILNLWHMKLCLLINQQHKPPQPLGGWGGWSPGSAGYFDVLAQFCIPIAQRVAYRSGPGV